MILHCAVTICLSEHNLKYISVAEKLFENFFNDFKAVYGADYISFNIHNIQHLISDVQKNGVLEKSGAFKFENELHDDKRKLKTGNKPLQQLSNRLSEQFLTNLATYQINSSKTVLKKKQKQIHDQLNCKDVYLSIELYSFRLDDTPKNKWFMDKSKNIVEFINATYRFGKIIIYGSSLKDTKNTVYDTPIKSSSLNIFKSSIIMKNEPEFFETSDIFCKLFCINETPNEAAFFPLLHTIQN